MQVGLAFLEIRSINGFVQWLMTFVAQESCSPASASGRTGNHKCCHLANIDIAFLLSPTQCISLRFLHHASQSLCRTQRNMRNELDNFTLGGALMAEYFRILWASFSHCVHRVHMSNESLTSPATPRDSSFPGDIGNTSAPSGLFISVRQRPLHGDLALMLWEAAATC